MQFIHFSLSVFFLVRARLLIFLLIIVAHHIHIMTSRHTKTAMPVIAKIAKAPVFFIKQCMQPGSQRRVKHPRIRHKRLLAQFTFLLITILIARSILISLIYFTLIGYHVKPILLLLCCVDLVFAWILIEFGNEHVVVKQVGVGQLGERDLLSLFVINATSLFHRVVAHPVLLLYSFPHLVYNGDVVLTFLRLQF